MTAWIVLGKNGFLGRRLMQALPEARGFGRTEIDLRKAVVLDVPADAVVVFASGLTPEHCRTIDGFNDNVAMAANVARWLETRAIRKLVYVSTDGVYPMIDRAVTEETPAEPDNFYTISKHAAERLLEAVCRARQIPLVIARPSAIYGAGDTHNSYGPNRFARSIVAEKSVKLFGEGEERRDHIHVDDVARLIARLGASDATGTYNLVTGESASFGEVVRILREAAPFPVTVSSQPRKGPITHRWYDAARLRCACPDFAFTDLKSGLKELLQEAK